jgi:hypothetical protein
VKRRDFLQATISAALASGMPFDALARHGRGAGASSGGVDPYAIRAPQAGDLYLDTTAGSDGSGTFASPWNNITAARLATLTAGQALWVRQGSVVAPWPDMGVVAMNSGTAGNPIIVSCYPTGGNWTAGTWETATINNLTAGTYGGSGYSGRIMINMAYWYFKGFSLNSADTGFRLGNGPNSPVGPCSNIRFIDITGTRNDSLGNTDNSGIIQWDVNNTGLIEIVRGSWTGPVKANNQACLFFDNSTAPITVIGALVVGSARPIYFKHNPQINPGGTIKNCIIDLTGTLGLGGQRDHVAYQNNVFIGDGVNSGSSVQLNLNGGGGPGATASYATFNHNTFYGSFTANGDLTSTNNTFTNTVIAGAAINGTPAGSGHDVGQYTTGLGGCTFDYTATDSLARYLNNHTTYTLSAFAAANPPNEAHGVTGAISFVGGSSGGGHSAAGWALVGGSAGKNAANDGTDCGVNAANLLTAN